MPDFAGDTLKDKLKEHMREQLFISEEDLDTIEFEYNPQAKEKYVYLTDTGGLVMLASFYRKMHTSKKLESNKEKEEIKCYYILLNRETGVQD